MTANPWLSREKVHAWSEAMGEDPAPHQAAIQRLLRDQRRLSKFVEENAKSLTGVTGGVAIYLIGVVLRMFELAGGRLRTVTWDDVRAAERTVGAKVGDLLPVDASFVERAKAMDRRQPHVLDEALYAQAYRAVGKPRLRGHQIALVLRVGTTLDEAVHKPWIPRLLRASRLPAKFAGLGTLQTFLERGFAAFKELQGADDFLKAIAKRELETSRRLMSGAKNPFEVE